MYIKVICAWCGKFLGIKPAGISGEPRLPISHGICCQCRIKLLKEAEESHQRHEEKYIHERR